jgi:hypothetical protein
MGPAGTLLVFGVALIIAELVFRTPFPVQPMKAIGAAESTKSKRLARSATMMASDMALCYGRSISRRLC